MKNYKYIFEVAYFIWYSLNYYCAKTILCIQWCLSGDSNTVAPLYLNHVSICANKVVSALSSF